MSTPAAIATVTAVLQHLLVSSTTATTVTTKPPAVARTGITSSQLNLFLYCSEVNSAFSNRLIPDQYREGESGHPPLALVLKYLISAYGTGDDDIVAHEILGEAMALLHDHPILAPGDIEGVSPDSKLQNQIEKVRITPETLCLDGMSKLWSTFQAEYRLSTAYQVSVVLIESGRQSRSPLPVLRRGEDNRGGYVAASPSPTITGLEFPHQKPAAELGDLITVIGNNLDGHKLQARFTHPLLDEPISILPEPVESPDKISLQIPGPADDAEIGSRLPAGFYTLTLVIEDPDIPSWTTNSLPMGLSPQILHLTPTTTTAGSFTLTLRCLPQIRKTQKVTVLFGDSFTEPDSVVTPVDPEEPTVITCPLAGVTARPEPYLIRIRVDGAESIPVDFTGEAPGFKDNQKVTVT